MSDAKNIIETAQEQISICHGMISSMTPHRHLDSLRKFLISLSDTIIKLVKLQQPTDEDFMEDLPQYHWDREDFIYTVLDSYPEFMDDVYKYGPNFATYEFEVIRYEDEFYILDRASGTMINWYKNLGRTNTCNKPLTLGQLEIFITKFKEDMEDYKNGKH